MLKTTGIDVLAVLVARSLKSKGVAEVCLPPKVLEKLSCPFQSPVAQGFLWPLLTASASILLGPSSSQRDSDHCPT